MAYDLPETSMPGMAGVTAKQLKGYSIKFYKADIDDLEEITMLQDIETRGLQGNTIVILEHDKFIFMDKYYIIVKYMEKSTSAD